jgi:hypothetical protein
MAGHSIKYLSTASVAYQRSVTFKNSCRIGWAGTISSHLIRELGSEAIGTDLRKSELVRKFVRLLCNPLEIIGPIIEALLFDRAQLRRTTRHAAILCAASLGCIVGEMTWRWYRKTACCDSSVLLIAEESIRTVTPENAAYSLT